MVLKITKVVYAAEQEGWHGTYRCASTTHARAGTPEASPAWRIRRGSTRTSSRRPAQPVSQQEEVGASEAIDKRRFVVADLAGDRTPAIPEKVRYHDTLCAGLQFGFRAGRRPAAREPGILIVGSPGPAPFWTSNMMRAAAGMANRPFIRDALILIGVLAILTMLALGQIAATVLIMVPMVFLLFGKRPEQRGENRE
jgi:hypothetical protein